VLSPQLKEHGLRLLRLLKSLAKDPRIPRPVRWLIVVGLLPVPGPFDEIVLALAVLVLVVTRPEVARTLWRESAAPKPEQLNGEPSAE
jgi:hypothetical protein